MYENSSVPTKFIFIKLMLAVLSLYLSSVLFRLVLDEQVRCVSSLALYSLGMLIDWFL
jgi:hypothetical protein